MRGLIISFHHAGVFRGYFPMQIRAHLWTHPHKSGCVPPCAPAGGGERFPKCLLMGAWGEARYHALLDTEPTPGHEEVYNGSYEEWETEYQN